MTITDKEALRALSWQALKAYLDRAGWQHAKDIPGKAIMYQHTDNNGRLREISVLTRDDLADYAARIRDALETLSRIEDRSELDIYEDLHALSGKLESGSPEHAESSPPVVDDATRAVHERIRKWLAEEGWDIREIPNRYAILSIGVTLQDGRGVRILQHKAHFDHITIARNLPLGDALKHELSLIPDSEQQDMLMSSHRDAPLAGVDLEGLDRPVDTVWHLAHAYFDGLTKDVLIQRILLVLRAHALSVLTLTHGLENAKRSDAAENLRSDVLREFPGVSDLLTAS